MILQILYFFIPAYIANMAPVFVKKINFLNYPVDFGKEWNHKRILGSHKTFRGFFWGTLFGFIAFELQRAIFRYGIGQKFALINYADAPIFLGALIAFSALLGDSIKSFFKRRLNIRPGRPWVPFDQLDFMVCAMLVSSHWIAISIGQSLIVLGIVFLLTLIVEYTGYKLKMKDDVL
ncbi:MAG: CDP-archaeol synthase [Bacteriovorax sp.]